MKKTALQAIVSTVALAGLLTGFAAQATNLAELPLKASVLAKPNVILGFDDSGSMDLEIMIDSNDGVFWWDHTNGNGWNAAGTLHRRIGGGTDSQWRRFVYLFPVGQGGGKNIKSVAATGDYIVPPTSQFGFLRSSTYNPQYYNPAITYQPWGAAHGYPATTFPQATATAARVHPLLGGATNTVDLTVDWSADTSNINMHFQALRGMKLPAGSSKLQCGTGTATGSCGSWGTVSATADETVGGNTMRLAMKMYPATYWIPATGSWDCTVDTAASVGTRSCDLAPDGTKMRRIEIRSTESSYPSGRDYAGEMQNFANWFQYHRKRRLATNAAMSKVLENINGLKLGLLMMQGGSSTTHNLSTGTRIKMYDLDSTSSADNGLGVLKILYEIDSNLRTPTRQTLLRIGQEFEHASGPIGFACQRNAAFIVTDGYANADNISNSLYTYSQATYGSGVPYATTHAKTLADIALGYYTRILRPAPSFPEGKVPTTAIDTNPNLHMNTYAVTLGARGTLYKGETTPLPTTTSAWLDHTADFEPTAVDDLWHATINGRGQMYLATTPTETAIKIQSAMNDILSQNGSQSGLAVSSVNLDRGDSQAYLGTYNPAGWSGNLQARSIDKTTGEVGAEAWSATAKLDAKAWTSRKIATFDGTSGVGFTAGAVGSTVNPGSVYGDTNLLMNYLRGDRTGEGTLWRKRVSLIGPVINAEPLLSRTDKLVYVASGEGMLHAFDTVTGEEHWAFVPSFALSEIGKTAERMYTFRTKLDARPVLGASGTKRILVGGMGAAGRGYYALDVSSPRDMSEATLASKAMWQFPASSDATTQAKMGYTVGQPVVVKSADHGPVVLVTSGYDNGFTIGDGKGRMWMLNADTGAILKEFVTTEGTTGAEAGLAHVSGFLEKDGTVRYAYGGDLLGNVWVFDLKLLTTTRLAVLKDKDGLKQPVTAAPELVLHQGKRVVLVGTGRLLDIGDFGSSKTQSFYAIADGTELTDVRGGALVKQVYNRSASPQLTSNPVDWTSARGWYFDLPAGEQANTQPTIAYGAVAFVTNMNGATDCSQSSYLYLVDVLGGTVVKDSTLASFLISDTATSSRVITLRVVGGKIVGTTHTSDNKVFRRELPLDKSIKASKNAWREVRLK